MIALKMQMNALLAWNTWNATNQHVQMYMQLFTHINVSQECVSLRQAQNFSFNEISMYLLQHTRSFIAHQPRFMYSDNVFSKYNIPREKNCNNTTGFLEPASEANLSICTFGIKKSKNFPFNQ